MNLYLFLQFRFVVLAFDQVYEPATFPLPPECENANLKIKFQCATSFETETVTLSRVSVEGDCVLETLPPTSTTSSPTINEDSCS